MPIPRGRALFHLHGGHPELAGGVDGCCLFAVRDDAVAGAEQGKRQRSIRAVSRPGIRVLAARTASPRASYRADGMTRSFSLASPARPDEMAAGSDHDALAESAIEARGDFAQAEVLNDPETFVVQQSSEFGRIKEAKPGLAARSRSCGHGHHTGTTLVQIIFEWFGVVEHDFGFRHAGDEIQRQEKRIAAQIWHHAEPLEECRAISPKARAREPVGQALPLEIDQREGERCGYDETRLFQALPLPDLRCRVIDLEYADPQSCIWVAQRERVEARAKHDDLAYAARHAGCQRILGKPAACGNEKAHRPQRLIGSRFIKTGASCVIENP